MGDIMFFIVTVVVMGILSLGFLSVLMDDPEPRDPNKPRKKRPF